MTIKDKLRPYYQTVEGGLFAEEGIMTTDTVPKQVAVEFEIGGKTCRMGGMAKGSGMINPNMATMLVFITTDAAVSPRSLRYRPPGRSHAESVHPFQELH